MAGTTLVTVSFLRRVARTSKANQQFRTLLEGRRLAARKGKPPCRLGQLMVVRNTRRDNCQQEGHRVLADTQ